VGGERGGWKTRVSGRRKTTSFANLLSMSFLPFQVDSFSLFFFGGGGGGGGERLLFFRRVFLEIDSSDISAEKS
jgi:hypothetical protein